MDYLSNVLKLPSWQKKQQCCCLCQADTVGENSWRDFSENAPWVATCWTPQTWHLFPQKSPCKLLNDIPGASAALVALDFMHNKYLGTDQYVFGSVMQLGFFALSFFLHFLFCTFFFALCFLHFLCFIFAFSQVPSHPPTVGHWQPSEKFGVFGPAHPTVLCRQPLSHQVQAHGQAHHVHEKKRWTQIEGEGH